MLIMVDFQLNYLWDSQETLKMYFYTSVSDTFQCSKYILKSNILP